VGFANSRTKVSRSSSEFGEFRANVVKADHPSAMSARLIPSFLSMNPNFLMLIGTAVKDANEVRDFIGIRRGLL